MIRATYRKFSTCSLAESLLFHPAERDRPVWYIEIHPMRIKYITLIPENSDSLTGCNAYTGVCSGLWNFAKRPFENHSFYQAVSEILSKVPFRQGSIYKKVRKGRISEKEALRINKKLNKHLNVLPKKGYLSQYELEKLDEMQFMGDVQVPRHEIIVGLDSNGDLVRLAGGKHRLAVAQHMGIERIPAVLSIVHKNATEKLPPKRRLVTGSPEDFRPITAS